MESKNQLETEKEVLNNELSVREDLKNSFASLNQKLEEEKKQWKAEKASLIEDREALREELQEEIVALTNELCQEKEAFQCLSQQCEEYEQVRFVKVCNSTLFNMFQLFALAVDLGSVPGEVTSDGQFFVRRIGFHASPFLPPNIHTYCMYRNSACVHVWFVLYAA
jgi:predicted nuclease with TOPRIM domain